MDKFVALLIAFFAFAFIWLYDTGRWDDIRPILLGQNRFNNTPASLQYSSYQGGTLIGTPNPSNNGGLGQIADTALCSAFPEICPFSIGNDLVSGIFDIFGIHL